MDLSNVDIVVEKPSHVSNISLYDGALPSVISPESRVSNIVEALLDDPNYGMAEKQDGHRALLAGDGRGHQMLTDKMGNEQVISTVNDTSLRMAAAAKLLNIGVSYVFDGEAIGGRGNWSHFVIFNVIMFNDNDWTQTTQLEREKFLCEMAKELEVPFVTMPVLDWNTDLVFLKTLTNSANKRAMYDTLKTKTPVSEGVIFRDMSSPMLDGTLAKVYKFPFIFELDVVAYKWNPGSSGGPGRGGSVEIGLYHNGELKRIGGLRSGLSYERLDYMEKHLEAGETVVVRVRFLGKRTIGTFLNQPRCEEIRTDKLALSCVTKQLIESLGSDRAAMFDEAPTVKE